MSNQESAAESQDPALSDRRSQHRHLKPRSAGHFTLPGLLRLVAVKKPAQKARPGINPFTGEEMTFAAKPAFPDVNYFCAAASIRNVQPPFSP